MANDPFVGIARILAPLGVDADALKHTLGVEFDPCDFLKHLRRGDEVAVTRTRRVQAADGSVRKQRLAHWHYGIYVGNGDVVDFGSTNDGDDATVELRTWGQFCSINANTTSTRTIRIDWPPGMGRSLEKSAEKAIQIATEQASGGLKARYCLHNCNCQHLATWCRLNRRVSANDVRAILDAVTPMPKPTRRLLL